MKHRSDPNTWRYGGILTRDTYSAEEPGLLMLYGGGAVQVQTGDAVILLLTGSGAMVVGIEPVEAIRA